MQLDRAIVDHASPTLARLKLGNLFNMVVDPDFFGDFARLRDEFLKKGVRLTLLNYAGGRALVYIYRSDELSARLQDLRTQAFLSTCGYGDFSVDAALRTLRSRLRGYDAFPHEIGVFLGYPLEDVIGFIENAGRNCLTCGCWKVYSNELEALKAFQRYEKCKAVYQRLFASGCPLSRLTVAARPA